MTKYIIVIGSSISGVGKGVSTASIGKILQEYGYSVTAIKIDPYLNYDAGTLRPTEHGEVWVTDDGGEIDQDLGNYERFLGIEIPKKNNITSGQIYKNVIDKERRGEYLGKTVQPVPHITDEVKKRVVDAGKDFDFALVEIGGTLGDYENLLFLFAMKSLERDIGKENMTYFLVTYLLIPRHIQEMKTKPTQHAIRELGQAAGIFPDFLLCRSPVPLDEVRKQKIEIYSNIKSDYIISNVDVDTIYYVPLQLEREMIGLKILREFGLVPKKLPQWKKWHEAVSIIQNPSKKIKIGIVGKYVDSGEFMLKDSYVSIIQALDHAGANYNVGIDVVWIDSKDLEQDDNELSRLSSCDGVIVPGGFGNSGIEGKIKAINYVREHNIPFLGLCYGMQLALVEFSRNVCEMEKANTTEVDPLTKYPIIDILTQQQEIIKNKNYGGTMRLGAYAALLDPSSKVFELYHDSGRMQKDYERLLKLEKDESQKFRLGTLNSLGNIVLERHRHRYEVNPIYIDILKEKGVVFSGFHTLEDGTPLVEFIELKNHPFFVATQAHPEFKSSLSDPSPLFLGFIDASLKISFGERYITSYSVESN